MNAIEKLSDGDLIRRLIDADKKETQLVLEILLFLSELDRRKIYLEAGYSSLFAYCIEKLKYSENAAYKRICCARLVSRFPEVLNCFREKEVNLTTLSMVGKLINSDNCQEIIDSVSGKSKREVEVFVARYRTDNSLKAIPKERVKVISTSSACRERRQAANRFEDRNQPQLFSPEKEGGIVVEEELRYELRLSVDEETFRAIEKVKSLLSGKYPEGAGVEEVMLETVALFLEKNDPERKDERRTKRRVKRQEGKLERESLQVEKIRANSERRSRYISTGARDRVYLRDQGQCTYVSREGKRCTCRHNLQVDHITPFAKGGTNEPENLRLLCQAHNLFEAEKHFGSDYIENKIREVG